MPPLESAAKMKFKSQIQVDDEKIEREVAEMHTPRVSEPESWDHAELDETVQRAVDKALAAKARWEGKIPLLEPPIKSESITVGVLTQKEMDEIYESKTPLKNPTNKKVSGGL